jgi:hypothetical protein
MKSLVIALMALPFMAGAAGAAQPLNDEQMDSVNGGFISLSIADAEGLVGESGIVMTNTATVSQVNPAAIGQLGETTSFLFKSLSAASSSTITATFVPNPLPVG